MLLGFRVGRGSGYGVSVRPISVLRKLNAISTLLVVNRFHTVSRIVGLRIGPLSWAAHCSRAQIFTSITSHRWAKSRSTGFHSVRIHIHAACTLALVTLLFALVKICLTVYIVKEMVLVTCVVDATATTVAFAIDVTIVTVVKRNPGLSLGCYWPQWSYCGQPRLWPVVAPTYRWHRSSRYDIIAPGLSYIIACILSSCKSIHVSSRSLAGTVYFVSKMRRGNSFVNWPCGIVEWFVLSVWQLMLPE
ncbi:hypothetical protein AG1IA_03561 [Rhizoctonia solani AG-1 IA]|uniref:Uncharacterized protein n=1 Tax=Thanatephorus cucumeris (strain AG1-IA) TaxID=983506 RepID=L8WZY7_THACA|nr:hypothetical protein AG1IA_03561 [Rhizoctonia solani AG-1 IA]